MISRGGPKLHKFPLKISSQILQVTLDEILRMQREKQEQKAERDQARRKILCGRGRVQTEKSDLFIDDA